MMSSKVSIVVPIYNAEKYLSQCIDSLINQDYENLEVLLINDGSLDGSGKICDNYQEIDSRVRVIHKENGGTASCRNLGLKESTGKYLMFIDADDWFELNTVSTLVSYMEENQLDVARFNYVREFGDKSLEKNNTFLAEKVYEQEECKIVCRQILGLLDKELSHPENMNFLASVCFNIFRRQLLVDNNLEFLNFKEVGSFVDGTFNLSAFMNVKRFQFIDKPFYHYRKTNSSSASQKYREDYVRKQRFLFENLKAIAFKDQGREDLKKAYYSRVAYNTMEMCINAARGNGRYKIKYKEIKSILKDEEVKNARKKIKTKHMPLKWKVYFFFIKCGWTLPTYFMTSFILKLKNRGV